MCVCVLFHHCDEFLCVLYVSLPQMKEEGGKVYHPRQSYDPSTPGEVSLGVGDEVRVFGNGRRLLKTYCITSGEAGYVPAGVLRRL